RSRAPVLDIGTRRRKRKEFADPATGRPVTPDTPIFSYSTGLQLLDGQGPPVGEGGGDPRQGCTDRLADHRDGEVVVRGRVAVDDDQLVARLDRAGAQRGHRLDLQRAADGEHELAVRGD